MLYAKQLTAVSDAELVAAGQRALDLARLAQARFVVPPSFVVLSTAFQRVLDTNNLRYKLDYLLARVDPSLGYTLTNAYTGVRKAILDASIPTDVEQEVKELYEAVSAPGLGLDNAPKLPVRLIVSMNRTGDSENNDTIIQCVRDAQEFLVALRECWALAYSPAQLAERSRERFPEGKLSIAVIVQAMRRQEVTVHAYSSVPQDKERVYLQAYRGYPDLRERITKDYYAISRADLKIVAQEVRDQPHALLVDETGALDLVAIDRKGQADHLAQRELAEISRLAKKAERELAAPIKAFFASTGEEHELLWVNRLGFDVLLEPEPEPIVEPPRAPDAGSTS